MINMGRRNIFSHSIYQSKNSIYYKVKLFMLNVKKKTRSCTTTTTTIVNTPDHHHHRHHQKQF